MILQTSPLILLFTLLFSVFAQAQSISIYAGYPYYFMQLKKYGSLTDIRNNENYSGGIIINKYFRSSKIEIGVAYATKNYYIIYHDEYSSLEKENIELNYYIIPILFEKRLLDVSNSTISLSFGTLLIKPFGYSIKSLFKDGTKTDRQNVPVNYKLGSTLRFGFKYSKKITDQFILYSELYANYKFIKDYYESGSSPKYFNLTDDRIDAGIIVGMEWLFKKSALRYYNISK